jgi:hypothetical protein
VGVRIFYRNIPNIVKNRRSLIKKNITGSCGMKKGYMHDLVTAAAYNLWG